MLACVLPLPHPGSAGRALIPPGRPRPAEARPWAEAVEVRVAGCLVTYSLPPLCVDAALKDGKS